MKTICAVLILVLIATALFAGDRHSNCEKAYRAAEREFKRCVLHVPDPNNEEAMKVELILGKTGGVSHYFFGGSIKEKTVAGWGYPRYDVEIGELASTMSGVPPDQPKVNALVTIGGLRPAGNPPTFPQLS